MTPMVRYFRTLYALLLGFAAVFLWGPFPWYGLIIVGICCVLLGYVTEWAVRRGVRFFLANRH